ncbi:MAG: archease [Chloroflexota bacterium]|nr:archease [Chloroflexota bacterium]
MDEFGYREIEHTADWELEVWAPNLSTLLEQAARGMYTLAGTTLQPGPRQMKQLSLNSLDAESLLVDFLDELLWLVEDEGLAFEQFKISIQNNSSLDAVLVGALIAQRTKEIKAVTYHNLRIIKSLRGLEVRIVFDV